jgi:hypothetical protein
LYYFNKVTGETSWVDPFDPPSPQKGVVTEEEVNAMFPPNASRQGSKNSNSAALFPPNVTRLGSKNSGLKNNAQHRSRKLGAPSVDETNSPRKLMAPESVAVADSVYFDYKEERARAESDPTPVYGSLDLFFEADVVEGTFI